MNAGRRLPPETSGARLWLLGLIPLALMAARSSCFRGSRRARARRAARPARRGARGRQDRPPPRRHRADGAQRRARRRLGQAGHRQRRLRELHEQVRRAHAARRRHDQRRLPLDRGRGLRDLPADLDGRRDPRADPRGSRDARGRTGLLRPDGAARHLRRRDPRAAGHALAAAPAALEAIGHPRADRVHDRPAGVPDRGRAARGNRHRRPGLAGLRRTGARLPRSDHRLPRAGRGRRQHALPRRAGAPAGRRPAGSTSPCSSPSGSASTTSARASRSAPPTPPARSRSAPCS